MLTIYSHEIGEAIKNVREWIGMSQKQLAIEAGVSPASISLLEKWQSRNIWLESLEQIMKALSNKPIKNKEYGSNTWDIVLAFK